ncbi:MAG: hypothetical protein BWY89_01968 [Bacteroidetes bacterium ADurb.BinA012]|nr:MAG: hypothetical protein BWY89_01968 [Bacteroidetes bacterium ADurb.BinA012]
MNKLIRRYLTQPLEAGDLGVRTELLYCFLPLRIGVAVTCLFLVAHPEKRSLQYVNMALADEIREELQEEGQEQQPDMHPVHIRIRGYHHIVVTEVIERLLNVESCLQQVELLVLVNYLLCQAVAVERLAPEAEDSLGLHVARLCDGAAGRVALGNEEG